MQPTWFGHVETPRDALLLFEACLNGTLHPVPRRLQNSERSQLIKSGCVFIYEEQASGIKRWTDGVAWSSSRVLGNFLVYRELAKPGGSGGNANGGSSSHSLDEKKKALNRNSSSSGNSKRITKPGEPYPRISNGLSHHSGSSHRHENEHDASPTPRRPAPEKTQSDREAERALVGSLVDSGGFKDGGLVKKTMSVNVYGGFHRLVSYYTIEDARSGKLSTPSNDPRLAKIRPRYDLVARQSFRGPEDADDYLTELMGGAHPAAGGYGGEVDLMMRRPTSYQGPLDLSYPSLILNSSDDLPPHARPDGGAGAGGSYGSAYSSSGYSTANYPSSCPSTCSSFSTTYSASYPTTQPSSQGYYSSAHGLPTPTQVKQEPYSLYDVAGDYSSHKPPLSVVTESRGAMSGYANYAGQITPISATPLPALLPPGETLPLPEYSCPRGSVWSEDSNGSYQADAPYKLEQPRWSMVAQESV